MKAPTERGGDKRARSRGDGEDTDPGARASAFEFDDARNLGKQGVVLTHADVEAREELRPPLAHNNAPGRNDLSSIRLDPEILRIAVPTVSG